MNHRVTNKKQHKNKKTGYIRIKNRTALIIILNGSINATRYRGRCKQNIVIPFIYNFGDDVILVNNIVLYHRTRIVFKKFRNCSVERMEDLLKPPNVNLIKNVWNIMKVTLNKLLMNSLILKLINTMLQKYK